MQIKKRNKFENLDVIEIKRKKIGQNLTKLDKNNKWLKQTRVNKIWKN